MAFPGNIDGRSRRFTVVQGPTLIKKECQGCEHCAATTVQCWACEDSKRFLIVELYRRVRHLAYCPEHGMIEDQCPADTHMIAPATHMGPMYWRLRMRRTAALSLTIGFLVGLLFGMAGAVAIARIYSFGLIGEGP